VYRKKGTSLRSSHVKPKKSVKLNTGAKGILVTCGVGAGKVLVFHIIRGRWGGDSAADMYKNVMAKALKKQFPKKKTFRILEESLSLCRHQPALV